MNASLNLAALLILTTIVGGCVSSSGDSQGIQPSATVGGGITDEFGGIRGMVLSEEVAPIVGAQVGILQLAQVATTDEAGSFEISGLAPGSYAISALALGYESKSQSVEVTAGAYTENVRFVLKKLAVEGPHHTTEVYRNLMDGYMVKATPTCMYPVPGQSTVKSCVGAGGCSDAAGEGCQSEQGYGHCEDDGSFGGHACDFTQEWVTMVGEVAWVPSSSATGRGFIFEVMAPNVTRGQGINHEGSVDQSDIHDFMHLDSDSPIRTVIDRDVLSGSKEPWEGAGTRTLPETDWCGGIEGEYDEGRCDWHWRLFPGWCTVHGVSGGAAGCGTTGPDVGLMQSQPVEVYFTYFILEAAPDGWSALPDV